jgi:hypothetical protein
VLQVVFALNACRWRARLDAFAVGLRNGFSQLFKAADLHDGTAAHAFVAGDVLSPGSSVGGWAVHEGDCAMQIPQVPRISPPTCGLAVSLVDDIGKKHAIE